MLSIDSSRVLTDTLLKSSEVSLIFTLMPEENIDPSASTSNVTKGLFDPGLIKLTLRIICRTINFICMIASSEEERGTQELSTSDVDAMVAGSAAMPSDRISTLVPLPLVDDFSVTEADFLAVLPVNFLVILFRLDRCFWEEVSDAKRRAFMVSSRRICSPESVCWR